MPIPISFETLLSGNVVEHARIEFKETWDAEASLKTICAFANDIDNWGGGYLVIGVRDQVGGLEPVGVDPASIDRILKDMVNKCKLIRPEYLPVVDVVEHEGKTFVVAWAPGGSLRPYASPRSMAKGEKVYLNYIRKMASTVAASDEMKRELYALSNQVPFDDRINHEASVDDLEPSLVRRFLKRVGSDLYTRFDSMDFVDVCRSMGIVAGPPEYLRPKNVGLMFFNEEPERFFPYSWIDVVEFPDGLGGDVIVENTFHGPLDVQLRDALRYLSGSVIQERVEKRPDVPEADRFFNYPYEALEEALANAVYHKGYDEREPIEVRVLPDRIEVLSHPGADRSITLEGLQAYHAYSRRYRNRRVGDFLKELRLTEGRNTGFSKMLRALRLNGSPAPLFETDEDRLYFMATFFIHPGFLADGPASKEGAAFKDAIVGLSQRQAEVLAFFREKPSATVQELCASLGLAQSTVNRDIKELKTRGLLYRDGSTKSGLWMVRG